MLIRPNKLYLRALCSIDKNKVIVEEHASKLLLRRPHAKVELQRKMNLWAGRKARFVKAGGVSDTVDTVCQNMAVRDEDFASWFVANRQVSEACRVMTDFRL